MSSQAGGEDPDGPGPVAGLSLRQFWKLCDAEMSDPVVLSRADVSRPFVYDRQFGFFYVPMGRHQQAMSLLLAFHHGHSDGLTAAGRLGLEYSSGSADHWLEHIPGTAFRSSQGSRVLAGRRGSLNAIERRIFGTVDYLFEARNAT